MMLFINAILFMLSHCQNVRLSGQTVQKGDEIVKD